MQQFHLEKKIIKKNKKIKIILKFHQMGDNFTEIKEV